MSGAHCPISAPARGPPPPREALIVDHDEILRCLRQGCGALGRGQSEQYRQFLRRARVLLGRLQRASRARAQAGEDGAALSSLYRFCDRRIAEALRVPNPRRAQAAANMLTRILGAQVALLRQGSPPMQQGPEQGPRTLATKA